MGSISPVPLPERADERLARRLADELRRGVPREAGPADGEGVRGDGRARGRRDRQPRREAAWSATTGSARRSSRPSPSSPARSPRRAPRIKAFAADVHAGRRCSRRAAPKFTRAAGDRHRRLGARAAARRRRARHRRATRWRSFFFDNTDPDGIDRTLAAARRRARARRSPSSSRSPAAPRRRATACSRPSAAYDAAGLALRRARRGRHRRGQRARPDRRARQGWLARFPMWDWVGGRTSRALGGRPAAGGAAGPRHRRRCSPARATMDEATRRARRARRTRPRCSR